MRIISWNCNGGLWKKFENISSLNADIYIIQECEDPSQSKNLNYKNWSENYLWLGDNKNKGVGVFIKGKIKIDPLNWPSFYLEERLQIEQRVKYFLPCRINDEFDLLAVWTHKNDSETFGYIGQLWKYIQTNKTKLNQVLIIGDLNSNSIWDQEDRWWNHSDVVRELEELNIHSLYHKYFNEIQGKERIKTLYHRKRIETLYHIDYMFGSQSFIDRLVTFEVGKQSQWISESDHMPIIADFDGL